MFLMFDIYSILKHFICLHICIVSLARDGAGEGAAIENIARIKPNGRNQMTIKVIRTRTFLALMTRMCSDIYQPIERKNGKITHFTRFEAF